MNKLTKQSLSLNEIEKTKLRHNKYYLMDSDIYLTEANEADVSLDYLCSEFSICEVIYNTDTQTFKYKLSLNTPNGTKEVTVDKSVFTSRNLESLTAKGFSFSPDKAKEVLKYALLEEANAKTIIEYTYLGFKNDYFWGFPRDEDKRCINRARLEQSEEFDLDKLNSLLKNAPMLQLAYTISSSSAVQSFLGQTIPLSTVVYHFYGDSSQGKTTALMTTSVWGKPTVETGIFSTWNQTELSLMNLLANNHGVTIALDESSICRFDMTSTLYNLSQGINRQRLQKNLQQQPTKEWLTTILSSGESSLLEHTNNNTGLKVRAIEFNEPVTLSAEHANKCKTFFLNNYGHTGIEIVELIDDFERQSIIDTFYEERTKFLESVKEDDKSPLTERLADNFAILLLTAQMLKILEYEINYKAIFKILLKKNREIGKGYDMGRNVLNAVLDRIVSKRSLYPDSNSFFGGTNIEGLIYPSGEIILLESAFDKIVNDNRFSSKIVCLRALERMGILKKQRKDTYFSKRTIGKVPTKVLVLKINFNKEEIL